MKHELPANLSFFNVTIEETFLLPVSSVALREYFESEFVILIIAETCECAVDVVPNFILV